MQKVFQVIISIIVAFGLTSLFPIFIPSWRNFQDLTTASVLFAIFFGTFGLVFSLFNLGGNKQVQKVGNESNGNELTSTAQANSHQEVGNKANDNKLKVEK